MTMPPWFADTISLQRAGDVWRGDVDPEFANGMEGVLVGQFGGWLAAALLKAAIGEAAEGQHPRSLVVHFLAPVRPGAFEVRMRALRKGRSVSFWQAELVQGEDVRAHATITLGVGRDDPQTRQFSARPDAPPADTEGLAAFSPPTPFGRALQSRWVEGVPFMGENGGRSLFWSRTAAPTRLDATSLALLSDYLAPRVFFVTNAFVASSTLSLNVYFHGAEAEIAEVGERHVLVEVRGRRIANGYWDHSASFWSPAGALLATTEQIAIHRG
jgi:acyl-CoA thioesterase